MSPVMTAAMACLQEQAGVLTLVPTNLPLVEKALRPYFGLDAGQESLQDSLPAVVEELCLFALWLEHDRGAVEAGKALLQAAQVALEPLRRLGQQGHEVADKLRAAGEGRDYRNITGKERHIVVEDRKPPQAGQVPSGPWMRHLLKNV